MHLLPKQTPTAQAVFTEKALQRQAVARQQKRWQQAWDVLMPMLWAVVLLEIAVTIAIGVAALL